MHSYKLTYLKTICLENLSDGADVDFVSAWSAESQLSCDIV